MLSVGIAKGVGFIPILLSGKVPVRPGWQRFTMQNCGTFQSARAGQNIGVLTGKPSGIIVLDIEKNELDLWGRELEKHGSLEETLQVRTGRGGLHVYFQFEDRVKHLRNAVKKANDPFDLKTTGGQVVWINSVTQMKYVPVEGYSEFYENDELVVDITLASMPSWIIDIFTKRQK